MQTPIQIRALRCFRIADRHVPVGAVVEVAALDAGEIVATNRAVLVRASDSEIVRAAVRAAQAKASPYIRERGNSYAKGF